MPGQGQQRRRSVVETPQVTAWGSLEPGLLGEGPRWHEQRQELVWVDILGRRFHRATLTAAGTPDRVRTVTPDRHLGAVGACGPGCCPYRGPVRSAATVR
jgi:sugar lactone lactonase YvrE